MRKNFPKLILICFIIANCSQHTTLKNNPTPLPIKTGLDLLFEKYSDMLTGKRIALITNHSGLNQAGISNVALFLADQKHTLAKIFSPEHGFTGRYADGEHIENSSTAANLPPIISLYGKNRKPNPEMLKGIDLIIYDIQDVGARFYTYISTMGLVMEAAAEADIPVMILDRPNPLGNKVEGPVLLEKYQSFVGKYPIPIRYGLTVGELAQLLIGEKMIKPAPELTVVKMENYSPCSYYSETNLPWVKPSPNIVDLETAIVYPGLCLLQGTNVSDGRGTFTPIKRVGAPWINSEMLVNCLNKEKLNGVVFTESSFTPIAIPSMATAPKFQDQECYGVDIRITDPDEYNSVATGITILYHLNKLFPDSFKINIDSMARLWGSDSLPLQLKNGNTPSEIINSYQSELDHFISLKMKYVLYE